MGLLQDISGPEDVRSLSLAQCATLAAECRDFLVDAVSRTGGHLGPNLGVVELTIALHRVFDSPRRHDRVRHRAPGLRPQDADRPAGPVRDPQAARGLSGYPSRSESEHDVVENSHASTALSYADGIAKAWQLRGETDRRVVAVVGDGALTGGMSWEALNTIASARDRPVIMVINDNGRSYAPTTGGLAEHLTALRTEPRYEMAMQAVRGVLPRVPVVGPPAFEALHGLKRGIKDLLVPSAMFEDLGLKYVGPVDGHDVGAVEKALRAARDFGAPVLVHVVTRKGFGYGPAEANMDDCFHGIGVFDALTGVASPESGGRTFTHVFSEAVVALGAADPAVVAITASMLQPVGLSEFATRFPDRVFDVGIAEQHAVTSATGMAMGGLKPVVALYATFLNRAFDQVLMDVALHRQPVTIVLDRAGVTGSDGPSHNGMWDLSMLGLVPGVAIAAPRDGATLVAELTEAVARPVGPTVVRFPKGPVGADVPAVRRVGGCDVLHEGSDVLLVSVGALARTALQVAARCADQGIGVTVVDPRWVTPVDPALVALAAEHRLVVTVEDGTRIGGVGTRIAQAVQDEGHHVPVLVRGLDGSFLAQGKRDVLLAEAGLGAQELARDVVTAFSALADLPVA